MSTDVGLPPDGDGDTRLPPGNSGVTLVENCPVYPTSAGDFTRHARHSSSTPRRPRHPDAISIGHQVYRNSDDSSPPPLNEIPNNQLSMGNFTVRLDDHPYAATMPPTLPKRTAPLNSNSSNGPNPHEEPRQGTISTETGSFYLKPINAESDILPQKRKQPSSKDGEASQCEEHDKKRCRRSES